MDEHPWTEEQHRARHLKLHQALDELLADWYACAPTAEDLQKRLMLNGASLKDFVEWSHRQTISPETPFRGSTERLRGERTEHKP